MTKNGWRRVSVIVAAVALAITILVGLAALSVGYGELRAEVREHARSIVEVRSSLPQMQEDIKEVLRAVSRIEGQLKIEGN